MTTELEKAIELKMKQAERVKKQRATALEKAKAKKAEKKADESNENNSGYSNKLKTRTYCITTGMRLHFKNGKWLKYNLGKLELLKDYNSRNSVSVSMSVLSFKKSVYRMMKNRLFTPDMDADIELEYTEVEKCCTIGGNGF